MEEGQHPPARPLALDDGGQVLGRHGVAHAHDGVERFPPRQRGVQRQKVTRHLKVTQRVPERSRVALFDELGSPHLHFEGQVLDRQPQRPGAFGNADLLPSPGVAVLSASTRAMIFSWIPVAGFSQSASVPSSGSMMCQQRWPMMFTSANALVLMAALSPHAEYTDVSSLGIA